MTIIFIILTGTKTVMSVLRDLAMAVNVFIALDPIEFGIITELAYSRLDPDVASFYNIKV